METSSDMRFLEGEPLERFPLATSLLGRPLPSMLAPAAGPNSGSVRPAVSCGTPPGLLQSRVIYV